MVNKVASVSVVLINPEDYFKRILKTFQKDKNLRILLGQSNQTDDRKGLYCFPGGKIKKGEHSFYTCCRETFEETGLNVEPIRKILVKSKPWLDFYLANFISGKIKPNNEFRNLKFLTFEEIEDLNNKGLIFSNNFAICKKVFLSNLQNKAL